MNDFEFDAKLRSAFQASMGAGSTVTEREGKKGGDKSVTVTGAEKVILHKFYDVFPRNSIREAEARGEKTEFDFRAYPTGAWIKLKINHPKSDGDETRIYFRQGIFYPAPGDVWFIYVRGGQPWIGCLSAQELSAVKSGQALDVHNGLDAYSEESYQALLNSEPIAKVTITSSVYRRDPSVAQRALVASGYKCELMPAADTFLSRATGKPYLEAHHLLPIFEQRNFPDHSLDVVENICIINPFAHKMLHHAQKAVILPHVEILFERRKPFFNALGVTLDRVMESYA